MSQPEGSQPKWYALTAEDAAKQLQVDPAKGLSAAEAQQRLQKYGPNKLAEKKKESGLQAFLRQYKDFMQIILLGAAVLSLVATREVGTTIVLVVLTVFNALLGLRGESKAEASLAALDEDDEEHRPRAPRRSGHRDRSGAVGAGRHRVDGSGQPSSRPMGVCS